MRNVKSITTVLVILFIFCCSPATSEAACFRDRAVVTKVTTKAKSVVQRTVRVLRQVLRR